MSIIQLGYIKQFVSKRGIGPLKFSSEDCICKLNNNFCLLHDLERLEIQHEQLHHPTFGPQIVVRLLLHWQCRSSHMKRQVLYLGVSV